MSNNTQQISLTEAIDLTSRYRNLRPANFFISETFEADAIRALLAVPGCQYLRIYLGAKSDDSVVAVLAAADASEADILPAASDNVTAEATTGDGLLLEDGYRCPEYCPPPSALNS